MFFYLISGNGRIEKFVPILERLCQLQIIGKYKNIGIFNVHAPIEEKGYKEGVLRNMENYYDERPSR